MNKLIIFLILLLASLPVFGQDNAVKVVALGEIIEIIPQERDDNADFIAVDIKVGQKLLKRFSTAGVTLPQIVGTFNWREGDYVIYRTDMGSGLCAGGSIYVLKFYENQSNEGLAGVLISPVLTTCLGENPIFGINYKGKDKFVLSIAEYELDLDNLYKWVDNKPPTKKLKRK